MVGVCGAEHESLWSGMGVWDTRHAVWAEGLGLDILGFAFAFVLLWVCEWGLVGE